VNLFGDPEEIVKYAYAIAKAIEGMGHTADLIFTDRHKTMKTVNALVLMEEMDRKKAEKQSMTRQEKVEYVNNWMKDTNIFLCDTLGLEDGPQYKFFDGYFHCTIHIKEASTFFAGSHPGRCGPHGFRKYTLYSVYATTANGTMLALGFAMLFGNEDNKNWTHIWKFIKKTHPIFDQSNFTIITNQNKGSLAAMEDIVPLAGRFLYSFYCQQKHCQEMRWRKGSQSTHS
jgi:hypothetical protein